MDEFRAGVTACLRSWSALRTAVESGWGGANSAEKADLLRSSILEHFDGTTIPPKQFPDVMDLEDALAIYMEEEFSLTLEDNSERQIADVIWSMYVQCAEGNVALARETMAIAESVLQQSLLVVVQAPEHDDDDDDDDDDDEQDDAMMDTEDGAWQDAVAMTTTVHQTATPAVSVAVEGQTTLSAADYAAQPLFGSARTAPKAFAAAGPVRQLGEAPPEIDNTPAVDGDGFAPVATKKKSRKPT
jgi:pre-rRNA-processing protein TSR2